MRKIKLLSTLLLLFFYCSSFAQSGFSLSIGSTETVCQSQNPSSIRVNSYSRATDYQLVSLAPSMCNVSGTFYDNFSVTYLGWELRRSVYVNGNWSNYETISSGTSQISNGQTFALPPTNYPARYYVHVKHRLGITEWMCVSGDPTLPGGIGNLEQYYYTSNQNNTSNTITKHKLQPSDLFEGAINGTQTIEHNAIPSRFNSTQDPVSYYGDHTIHWEKDVGSNNSWEVIPNSNSVSYQAPRLTQTTSYKRVISNGCYTKQSNIITVTVNQTFDPGAITANQTICYNTKPSAVTFSRNPAGGSGGYTYQWQSSSSSATSGFSDIGGYTSSTFSYSQNLTGTIWVRCKVKTGSLTDYTNAIKITVRPSLSPGSIRASETICFDTKPSQISSTSSASGGSGDLRYSWQYSSNQSSWSTISNETSLSYQPDKLTSTRYYRRVVTDNVCNNSVNSNTSTVTVLPEVKAGAIGSSQTICYNTKPDPFLNTKLPTGGDGDFNYVWQSSSDGSTWVDIPNSNSTNLNLNTNLTKTTRYRRVENNACSSVQSNTITITVLEKREPGVLSDDQVFCPGNLPAQISNVVSPSGGYGSYNYRWEQSSTGTGGWTTISDESENFINPGFVDKLKFFRRVETDACATTISNTVRVAEAAPIDVNNFNLLGVRSYCKGENVNISVEIPSDFTANWVLNNTESLTGSSISFPDIQNTFTMDLAVVDNNGCSSNSKSFTVHVPTLTSGFISSDQTICYNTKANLITNNTLPISSSNTLNYAWEYSYDKEHWFTIPNSNTFELSYPSNLTETTYFRRAESNECATLHSNISTVAVLNERKSGSISGDEVFCYGSNPSTIKNVYFPSGGYGSFSFQWQVSNTGSGGWSDVQGEVDNFLNVSNFSGSKFFRRLESDACATTISNTAKLTESSPVNVENFSFSGFGTYCSGDDVNLAVLSPNTKLKYYWILNHKDTLVGTSINLGKIQNSVLVTSFIVDDNNCKFDNFSRYVKIDSVYAAFDISNRTINVGSRVNFVDKSINASSWSWNLGLFESYNVQNPSVFYNVPGFYDVSLSVVSPSGCTDMLSVEKALEVIGATSSNFDKDSKPVIFPNPSRSGLFKITWGAKTHFNSIRVINASGAVVLEKRVEASPLTFNINAHGVYVVLFLNNNSVVGSAKILKL